MSLIDSPPIIKKESWESAVEFSKRTRQALQQLAHLRLGVDSSPTFENVTIDGLSATRLVQTDGSKKLTSVSDLTAWVAGTANEIDVADDGDGTITIGIVNPLIVGKGGTGTDALTDHSLLVGSGADAVTLLGVASDGQIPIGSAGADPVLAALTGTANQVIVANAAGSITLSTPQDIDTDSTPTFAGLTLVNAITEFSTDDTLGDDSDSAVPTEQAVKTYIDSSISDIKVTRAFFTAATGDGVISNETYEANTVPANKVLTAFQSDNDGITVAIEIHSVGDSWMPADVTVSGGGSTPVQVNKEDWTQIDDTRMWTASVTLVDADTTGTLTATMSDGDTSTCEYTRAADPPDVSNAEWGEGDFNSTVYPTDGETGLQTAVKAGDTVSVQLDLSSEADTIRVCTGGASSADQDFSDGPYSGTVVLDDVVVVGGGTGAQVFTIKAKRTESDYGASDTTSNITLDQAAHDYTALHNTVFDPVENFALKSGDSCTGDVEITNWAAGDDVIAYASDEVTITNSTTYVETKTYTYLAGTYRDSGTNITITSRRKANGKQDTHTYRIDICNAAPTLTLTGATTRLRSKTGADKTYSLTITSNYELQACTCVRDVADDGPALGAWTGNATGDHTWTNTITIEEDDTKNVAAEEHTWEGVLATTGSGLTVAAINTNPNYTVGGFESRDINFAAYETHNAIGTMATNKDNANKLTCEIVGVKELTYVGNDTPAADRFTITDAAGDFDADGTHVMCLDTDFINLGLTYILRTEEVA